MGRNEKYRSVNSPPRFFTFHSELSPTETPREVEIRLDEYEALRLSDELGYDHGDASAIMNISRPTFTRLLNRARKKAADFLVNGGCLRIVGGTILFSANVYCCRECHRPFQWNGDGNPACPRCAGNNVLKAQPSCAHDCRCCEAGETTQTAR